MFSETKTSFNQILNERLTSPFYGALIITWVLWNWQTIYLTLFIDQEKLSVNKLDFILANYTNPWINFISPLISTLFLIAVFPFVTNYAYYLSLKFNQWKVNKKNAIEMKQLLTLEQSIQLREQIANQENKFSSLLTDKNEEIKRLTIEIDELKKNSKPKLDLRIDRRPNDSFAYDSQETDEINHLAKIIMSDASLVNATKIISDYIQKGSSLLVANDEIDSETLTFFESKELVKKSNNIYSWTKKGKRVINLLDHIHRRSQQT